MAMIHVKICGMTNEEDTLAAASFGADAVGFIFHPPSPRYITPKKAEEIISKLPPFLTTVGVFVNKSVAEIKRIVEQTGLDIVQLHGHETPQVCKAFKRVIKVIRVKDMEDIKGLYQFSVSAFLFDTFNPYIFGGSGKRFDWEIARRAKNYGPIILAGGLNPNNIEEAVQKIMPYGVDVVSGVEGQKKGKKDFLKMKKFIERAKSFP